MRDVLPEHRSASSPGAECARKFCATLLVAWSLSTPAQAAQLSLAWDASASSAVAGYFIHYGTASRSYATRVHVGNVTSYTLANLAAGQTYFVAVTAHDAALVESAYSNEVSAIPSGAVPTTTALAATPNPSVAGTDVTFTAIVSGSAPTGTVAFRTAVTIPGCDAVALSGTGNARTATCTSSGLAAGSHAITASYAGDATNAASASAVVWQVVDPAPWPATFVDVPPGHWAFAAVEALAHSGITLGCTAAPRQFCPEDLVSRAEMAVFLERAMRGSAYVYSPTGDRFADVPIHHWAVGPIEQLHDDGITSGCATAPLRYCPTDYLTRASMAVFLLRAKFGVAYSPGTASGTVFADVAATHWAASWIEALYALGFTAGCASSPTRYCPDGLVSRAEMAVFLYRVFDLPDPP